LEDEKTNVQNELDDHELRIDALEATNPEALRGLSDVNFGTLPNPGKDQYTVKYDNTSDTFMLLPDNSGINEAPIDNLKYARKNEDWVEVKDIQTFNNLTDVNIIGIA
jgi:hypothetical protein